MKERRLLWKSLKNRLVTSLIFYCIVFFSATLSLDLSCAQEFPSKEIKLIVPIAAGGSVDIIGRLVAEKVEKILGVPAVVVNNAAGGGVAACVDVSKANPDGHTLLVAATGYIVSKPLMIQDLAYRYTDFAPVCRTALTPVAIFVRNDAPWKNLKELVNYARKNPGKLRGAMGPPGGFMDILARLFRAESGINVINVPTAGGSMIAAALLGGHAEISMDPVASDVGFLRAGRLRALVSTDKLPEFTQVGTFAEEGYPGVSLKLWHGIFAPKGLPKPILTKITKAYEKALSDPTLQESFRSQYIFSAYLNPEETSKLIEDDIKVHLRVFKQSGMIK